jgi:hypothetical protein
MRAVPGWMCKVDFDYELGEALGGTTLFSSKEDLNRCRKCTAGKDKDHRPVEVVTMSKEDFARLVALSGIDPRGIVTSNVGPAIWTKEEGLLKQV